VFPILAFGAGCQEDEPSKPLSPEPPSGDARRVLRVPSEFPSIKAAIDEAEMGDTILVASGVYRGIDNRDIDFGGIDLVLRSEAGSGFTFLECNGFGRAFYLHSGETRNAVIEGFTVRNGAAEDPQGEGGDAGGGARFDNCSPTVRDCRFLECRARFGGAVFAEVASPRFERCVFRGNWTTELDGGGLYLSNGGPEIDQCEVTGNRAERGGGIYSDRANPRITRSTIAGNFADDAGGGVYVRRISSMECARTILSGNGSSSSGADASVLSGASLSVECCALDSSRVAATGRFTIKEGLIASDPGFCEAVLSDLAPTLDGVYQVVETSSCRPSGNECGVLIGFSEADCSIDRPIPIGAAITDGASILDGAAITNGCFDPGRRCDHEWVLRSWKALRSRMGASILEGAAITNGASILDGAALTNGASILGSAQILGRTPSVRRRNFRMRIFNESGILGA
jgi:hypothetical protein